MSPQPRDPAATVEQTQWFVEEVHPHEGSLRSYLNGAFPGIRDVDDVIQESFIRVWRARAAHPIDSARAFLFTVARRLAVDAIRRNRRTAIETGGDLGSVSVYDERLTAAETLSRDEKVRLLINAIDSLPPRCREIVILRKLKLLPQREVAFQLGVSEKAVENLLSRGIERCRKYLKYRGIDNFMADER